MLIFLLTVPPVDLVRTFLKNKWTASSEFGTYRLCEQRRFRRACASAQSRQNLRCSLIQAVSQEESSDRKPDSWPLCWACAVKICHDGMLEDTNSLNGAQICLSVGSHNLLCNHPVKLVTGQMSPVKRICVFEHSVMTNFNCACPAIQRGQGSGFLSEGSS